MTDEEQLKCKVKQQKTLIVSLLVMIAGLTVVCLYQVADSLWKSRLNNTLLQQMELHVEQMEYQFQKRIEAIESKVEAEK